MLDHYSLVVLVVHPVHGIENFADRGIDFDSLDDHRHQVASTARSFFDGLQRGLPFRGITPGAQRPSDRPACAPATRQRVAAVSSSLRQVRRRSRPQRWLRGDAFAMREWTGLALPLYQQRDPVVLAQILARVVRTADVDPGIHPASECVRLPVVGIVGQSCCHLIPPLNSMGSPTDSSGAHLMKPCASASDHGPLPVPFFFWCAGRIAATFSSISRGTVVTSNLSCHVAGAGGS
jgi:hypothetical protein